MRRSLRNGLACIHYLYDNPHPMLIPSLPAHARRIQIRWRPLRDVRRARRPASPAPTVLSLGQGCVPVCVFQAHGQGRMVRPEGIGAACFPSLRWVLVGGEGRSLVGCIVIKAHSPHMPWMNRTDGQKFHDFVQRCAVDLTLRCCAVDLTLRCCCWTPKRQENRSTGSRSTLIAPCFSANVLRRVSYNRTNAEALVLPCELVINASTVPQRYIPWKRSKLGTPGTDRMFPVHAYRTLMMHDHG